MKIERIQKALLSLRLGVFVVMFVWTIDKFVNPQHTAAVFSKFYMVDGLSFGISYFIGAIQLVLVLGFLAGLQKKWTYGAILVMHSISTLSSYKMYLDPTEPKNLLFFAAIPMLAAIYSLFILRDQDTLLTVKL